MHTQKKEQHIQQTTNTQTITTKRINMGGNAHKPSKTKKETTEQNAHPHKTHTQTSTQNTHIDTHRF